MLAAGYRYTRFGLLTRATAESQTGAYVSGVSPDRVALRQLDDQRRDRRHRRHPHRPGEPAHAGDLHAVRGPGAGRRGGRAGSRPRRRSWPPASPSACCSPRRCRWPPTTTGCPSSGVVRAGAAGRHPRRAGRRRRGHARAGAGCCASRWAGPRGRGRSLAHRRRHRPSACVGPGRSPTGRGAAAVIGTFIAAVIGLSLVVVTGYAGQVSLAQLALAGTARVQPERPHRELGRPFPLAPLLAALVATVIGVVVGLPALRLRGADPRGGDPRARLRHRGGVVPQHRHRRAARRPGHAAVDVRRRPGHRRRQGVPADRVRPRSAWSRWSLVALGVAVLRRSTLGLGDARRPGQRALGRRPPASTSCGSRWSASRIASFIAGLGGSLLAYRRGAVTFDSFTALGGLALLSHRLPRRRHLGVGRHPRRDPLGLGHRLLRPRPLGRPRPVVRRDQRLLLIVTLIAHPEGLAGFGHASPTAGSAASAAAAGRRRPPARSPPSDAPTTDAAPNRRAAGADRRAPALAVRPAQASATAA